VERNCEPGGPGVSPRSGERSHFTGVPCASHLLIDLTVILQSVRVPHRLVALAVDREVKDIEAIVSSRYVVKLLRFNAHGCINLRVQDPFVGTQFFANCPTTRSGDQRDAPRACL
jgi:hypothetical protein